MDHSTENVTLFATFINDVLKNYEDQKEEYSELFRMVEGVDLSDPFNEVPMQLYNDICAWIEENLGKYSLIRAGRNIGETVFTTLVENKMISEQARPIDVMKALKEAASQMIQDPKNRGWEILDSTEKSIIMRRTQTFNSQLQFGLLDGLVRKTGVFGIEVHYLKSVEEGNDFDEYQITWG